MLDETDKISLLTFVLQKHHLVILRDWLDFFDTPVVELVVNTGEDDAIAQELEHLCGKKHITLRNLGAISPLEAKQNEPRLLMKQFEAAKTPTACVVRLDCLPYRLPGQNWQRAAFVVAKENDAQFITGSSLPFKADEPTEYKTLMLTQRASNGFLVIPKEYWIKAQESQPNSEDIWGRFAPEAALEAYVLERGHRGIRIVNSTQLRIFHVQEWGRRLLSVRDNFLKGKRIDRYLTGYQDDFLGAKQRYYMHKGTKPTKRIRIWLGKARQRLFKNKFR